MRHENPAWVAPLVEALAEALPRLHGCPPDPGVAGLIQTLTEALTRGELDSPLDGNRRRALTASPLVREPDGPLVLEDDRLQWRRWQERRQQVIEALLRRVGEMAPRHRAAAPPDHDHPAAPGLDARQRRAVEAVRHQGLVLLEGGPGTGKTSTVVRMLEAVRHDDPQCRIHLAAPTGKAAARLRSALAGTELDLPCTTLHRLLESRGERFGRTRTHPLLLDLLVVDEVSMVDLELLGALLEALPDAARLVLVGDPAQLPPVAPGPVLLELQRPALRARLGTAAITLTTTYRNDGAIAEVAAALRTAGDDPIAAIRPRLEGLTSGDNLRWLPSSPSRLPDVLLEALRRHQQRLAALAHQVQDADPDALAELLAERDELLVLSPTRLGRWGVEAVHKTLLGEAATQPAAAWPAGTPALCGRNLPELGLANGDVGLCLRTPAGPRLVFDGAGAAEPIHVHPAQLAGAVEPALALTVHKAQGSEARSVIVLLPGPAPGAGRLLYTALTRARRQALLITPGNES